MAFYSDPYGYMSSPSNGNGNVFQSEPNHFNSYGYSHVVPICQICGTHGHTPADCQRGYSPTHDCYGMNFAQQHGSYHNNYSAGWPENTYMTCRNDSPPISSFPSSYPMQGYRCEDENQYNSHEYSAPTYAPEFHQEQPQFNALFDSLAEQEQSWMAEIKKQQLELMDKLMQMNEKSSQVAAPVPIRQPQEFAPMELNGPPEVQAPKEVFDDIEKLGLLCLEFYWSSEDDPLRLAIIKEMKKIKDGRDLVEELIKIEKKMNFSNKISSQLELELTSTIEDQPELIIQDLESSPCVTELHDCWKSSVSPLECSGDTDEENIAQKSGAVVSAPLAAHDSEKVETLQDQSKGVDNYLNEGSMQDQIIVMDINMKKNDMEVQVDMPIVIQVCDESGLSNPLNGMFPTEFSAIVLHCSIPSLKLELKRDMLKTDNAYSAIEIAHAQNDGSYYPHAKILLKDACSNIAHVTHVDTYHP